MSVWRGRTDDAEGSLGRRWHQLMQPLTGGTPRATTVLLGFACDAGVARNHGRVGAAGGPAAIRQALRNIPVHDCRALADGGNIVCDGDALESAQHALGEAVRHELDAGRFPLVLGGGHEMAYASFSGLAAHAQGAAGIPRIGIFNFDAHFDLRRDERATSGTPFLQALVDAAGRERALSYRVLGISEPRHHDADLRALRERHGVGIILLAAG